MVISNEALRIICEAKGAGLYRIGIGDEGTDADRIYSPETTITQKFVQIDAASRRGLTQAFHNVSSLN